MVAQSAADEQPGVVEMLAYVKALGIDPMREPFLLWVAEAAYKAELPPDWAEYMDPQGRIYFYCSTSGASSWTHPLDDTYRDVIGAYRDCLQRGGFWFFEDAVLAEERRIECELGEKWRDGTDDRGERFFHNAETGQSTYEDPKGIMYHKLYTKLNLLAAMKDRHPQMAAAPRPDPNAPLTAELQQKKAQDDKLAVVAVRVQAAVRALLAKRRFKEAKEKQKATGLARGIAPSLRGKLRLRVQMTDDGKEELLLSQTTGARRDKAAVRIQALARSFLVRKRIKPLLMHRRHLGKMVVPIQSRMRIVLAKKRVARIRNGRFIRSATSIQAVQRGIKGRERYRRMMTEQGAEKRRQQQIILLQCCIRMQLAIRRRRMLKAKRRDNAQIQLASAMKSFLAAKKIQMLAIAEKPVVCNFMLQHDAFLPWRFRLQMAPVHSGRILKKPNGVFELFNTPGAQQAYVLKCIIDIQRILRGSLVRIAKLRRMMVGRAPVLEALRTCLGLVDERQTASVTIQARARGFLVRNRDIEREQLLLRFGREGSTAWQALLVVQQVSKKFWAQQYLKVELANQFLRQNATTIQRHFRGFLGRKLVEDLVEESCWPLRGFFDYQQTGPDSVLVQVNFHPARHFDEYRYFERFGDLEDLSLALEEMEIEVALCVDQYLQDRNLLQPTRTTVRRQQPRPMPIAESPRPPASPSGRFLMHQQLGAMGKLREFGQTDAEVAFEGEAAATTSEAPPAPAPPEESAGAASPDPLGTTQADLPLPTAASPAESSPAPAAKKKAEPAEKLTAEELENIAVNEELDRAKDWDAVNKVRIEPSGGRSSPNKKGSSTVSVAKKEHPPSPLGMKSAAKIAAAKEKGPAADKAGDAKKRKVTNSAFIFTEPDSCKVRDLFKSNIDQYAPDMTDLEAKIPPRKNKSPERVPTTSSKAAFDPRRPGTGSSPASPSPGDAGEDDDKDGGEAGHSQMQVGGSSGSRSPASKKKHRRGQFPEPLPRNPFRPELTVEHSMPGKVPDRRSYAGEFRDGRFYKNARGYKDLSEKEKQSIVYDLKEERKKKVVFLARRKEEFEEQQAQRQIEEREKFLHQMEAVDDEAAAREARRVATLTAWLAEKEKAAREKKKKEEDTIELVKRKAAEKQERLDRLDQQRAEERERRLRSVEKKKYQLVKQIEAARHAEGGEGGAGGGGGAGDAILSQHSTLQRDPVTGEVHRHVHHHIHYHHVTEDGEEELSQVARVHIERESEATVMLPKIASAGASSTGGGGSAAQPMLEGRVHHEAPSSLSGTDADADGAGPVAGSGGGASSSSAATGASGGGAPAGPLLFSPESSTLAPGTAAAAQQVQEQHVTQQHVHYHVPQGVNAQNFGQIQGLLQPGATMELLIPPMLPDATIEKKPGPLSPKGLQKLGKKTGLRKFCHNVSTAIDAYADTRRPRFLRGGHPFVPLPLPHERGNSGVLGSVSGGSGGSWQLPGYEGTVADRWELPRVAGLEDEDEE